MIFYSRLSLLCTLMVHGVWCYMLDSERKEKSHEINNDKKVSGRTSLHQTLLRFGTVVKNHMFSPRDGLV